MKKILLALISFLTLGVSTSAQATYTVVVNSHDIYDPYVKTYTDWWGKTVVVVEKNPKQKILEVGAAACIGSAVLGVKGVADICVGLANVIKGSRETPGLLPLGLLEVSGATLIGALGYLALKSLATSEVL